VGVNLSPAVYIYRSQRMNLTVNLTVKFFSVFCFGGDFNRSLQHFLEVSGFFGTPRLSGCSLLPRPRFSFVTVSSCVTRPLRMVPFVGVWFPFRRS
jgi:hypothetical protein